MWPATCWAPSEPYGSGRSSSPTSTTWVVSTAASPTRPGTDWSCGAIWRRGEFIAFWLRDGAVAAALNVNMWDDGDALQELVDTGRP